MKALKKKWNSCQGASILLALLFLLVCMMAAASIVMAAASNAGKIDSNKKEQQKYLTLASALNLLCDELENVKYVGQYDYVQEDCKEYIYLFGDGTEVIVTGEPGADEDIVYKDSEGNTYQDGGENSSGAILRDSGGNAFTVHDKHRIYTQTTGALTRDDGNATWLSTVLPLLNDLDYIFANQFYMPESKRIAGDYYDFTSLLAINGDGTPKFPTTKPTAPQESYTMTFTMTLGDLTEAEKEKQTALYGDLLKTVQIEVKLWTDGRIELTATLMDGSDPAEYVMTAVLKPVNENWRQELLVPGYHNETTPNGKTDPVKWEREYIAKGEGD